MGPLAWGRYLQELYECNGLCGSSCDDGVAGLVLQLCPRALVSSLTQPFLFQQFQLFRSVNSTAIIIIIMKNILCTTLLILLALLILSDAAFNNGVPPSSKKLVYVPCIALKNLPKPGSAVSSVVAGGGGGVNVCIVVDPKGFVYCLDNKCPPMGRLLSSSVLIDESTITDSVFGTKFSLQTGEVVGEWCPRIAQSGLGLLGASLLLSQFSERKGVATFPIRQRNGIIEVEVII